MKRKPLIACMILVIAALAAVYVAIIRPDYHHISMVLPGELTEQNLVRALDSDGSHNMNIVGCHEHGAGLLVLYSFVDSGKSFVGLVQMDDSLDIAKTHFVDRYDDNSFGYYRRIDVGDDTSAVFGICHEPDQSVLLYQGLIPQTLTPEKGFYFTLLPVGKALSKITNGDLVIQGPQASLNAAATQHLVELLGEKHNDSIHLVGLDVKEVYRYEAYDTPLASEIIYATRITFESVMLGNGTIDCALLEKNESTYKGIGEISPELKATLGTTNAVCRYLASACGIDIKALDGTVNYPMQSSIRYILPEKAAQDEKEAARLLVQAFLRDLSNENLYKKVPSHSFVITDFEVLNIEIITFEADPDTVWEVHPDVHYSHVGYLYGEKEIGGLRLYKRGGYYMLTSSLALPDREREYGGLYLDSFVLTGRTPGDDDISTCVEAFLRAMVVENSMLQASDVTYRLDEYTYSAEGNEVKIQASIRSTFKDITKEGIHFDVESGKYNVPNDWLSGLGSSKDIQGTELVTKIVISMQYDALQDVWHFSQRFAQ